MPTAPSSSWQGRHALPAAGLVTQHPSARTVHLRTGERAAGQLPAQAGQADIRQFDHRRGRGQVRSWRLEFEKDDLYDEAARIVVSSGQVSISYLQRKLRVGFSRAARLVDMMEAEGLVSPGAGGKPREVLVDRGYFEEVDAQLR
jgi:DNA segregation ATPase FtsK/SpoIIIE-like protein